MIVIIKYKCKKMIIINEYISASRNQNTKTNELWSSVEDKQSKKSFSLKKKDL